MSTSGPADTMPTSGSGMRTTLGERAFVPRWWIGGDLNAFLGLFANIVANMLVGASLLVFVVRIPANIVFGQIMPALALSIFAGNLYYAWMARRESIKRGIQMTALPYGPSVGHLFVVTFLIIFPVFRATNNPILAWQVGVAWAIVEAVTEIVGSFIGPWVRRHTPRAAMLAVMAGIALTLIGMNAAFRVWEAAYIGLLSLAFVLVAWTGGKRLPGNVPAAVWMIAFGTLVAWVGTALGWIPDGPAKMDAQAATRAVSGLTLAIPGINVSLEGFAALAPYLIVAIPLGIGGFLNTMDNVESASAAGDEYDTREAMLADASGSILGSLFGNPFATGVYVGHAGWKTMGAGPGYTVATAFAVLLVACLGILSLFQAVIPLVAVFPILIYIAMVMTAQAFQATPPRHAPAVVLAMLPWVASWGKDLVDNTLTAAGTNAFQVGLDKLAGQNVLYAGMLTLSQGSLLTSMILGAATAFVIDRRFRAAATTALIGAALSFFGFMHAAAVGVGAAWGPAIGYLLLAGVIYAMEWVHEPAGAPGPEVAWRGPPEGEAAATVAAQPAS